MATWNIQMVIVMLLWLNLKCLYQQEAVFVLGNELHLEKVGTTPMCHQVRCAI